jgi:hypothetical protein
VAFAEIARKPPPALHVHFDLADPGRDWDIHRSDDVSRQGVFVA